MKKVLKCVWFFLLIKHLDSELLNPVGNFKNLRNVVESSSIPLIPYIGCYLSILSNIQSNKDYINDGIINFHKKRIVYDTISNLKLYQSSIFNFKRVDKFQTELMNNINDSNDILDDDLYKVSLLIEPNE